MKKVAVLLAPGFEEGEALTIIDIFKRASIDCSIVGVKRDVVTGSHDISIKTDVVLNDDLIEMDMIVLPGGLPGSTNLRDNEKVIELCKKMSEKNKFVCAMCAAPIVLDRAGLLVNKNYTAYPGYEEIITSGTFRDNIVVVDGNIVTSRGPATGYAFGYTLVDLLGGSSDQLKEEMAYYTVFNKEDVYYG